MMSKRTPSTALILLAAGSSSRMGVPKQLLQFKGKPLLRHSADVAVSSGCKPIIVVLGFRQQELRAALAGLDVDIVVNERWADGMGRSIQTGLKAIDDKDIDGAVLALADQPFVTAEFLSGLVIKAHETRKRIVGSRYADTVGVPAFFAQEAFQGLLALEPDRGCKALIQANPLDTLLIDCPQAARDIDTPEDYARALIGKE
jgi:molybdenum cofactor cytidylyltransferase